LARTISAEVVLCAKTAGKYAQAASLTASRKPEVPDNAAAIYKTGAEFLAELRLIQRNLTENRS